MQKNARDKLLDNTDTLGKQADQINSTIRVGYETADTTNRILANSRDQREKIINATQDVREANKNTALGKMMINSMSRKECCYKSLLYLLIVVLFAAIVALFIARLAK